jgi:hypothetical protein
LSQQGFSQMTADKACAAGDESLSGHQYAPLPRMTTPSVIHKIFKSSHSE